MNDLADRDPGTIVAHDERHFGDAVVPPIFQTSLFTFSSYAEMAQVFAGDDEGEYHLRPFSPGGPCR